jgi:transposase
MKKIVSLDVHSQWSQLTVISDETGELLLEMKVRTDPAEMRQVVAGLPGPKKVLFEEGPMSGLLRDALEGVADEVVSCDPTKNALVARSEHSTDELDARRLGLLCRAGVIHPVYVPIEPYRTLRSLVRYDHHLARSITRVMNTLKAALRRQGVPVRGKGIYRQAGRKNVLAHAANSAVRWHWESLYRHLDWLRRERVGAHRVLVRQCRGMPVTQRLRTIPGVGPIAARTIVAWLVDPERFKSRKALCAYGGLGLGQGFTNWTATGRARASRRGQRELKRALFLSAHVASRGTSALGRRYRARRFAGWEHRKAIRDVARSMLFIAKAVWTTGKEYDDTQVNVPRSEPVVH